MLNVYGDATADPMFNVLFMNSSRMQHHSIVFDQCVCFGCWFILFTCSDVWPGTSQWANDCVFYIYNFV